MVYYQIMKITLSNVIFFILLTFCALFGHAEENNGVDKELKDVLKIYRWSIPVDDWAAIKFLDNDVYLMGQFGEGGDRFCKGTYEIVDNKIVINYPHEITESILSHESSKKHLNGCFLKKI
jgi:hypothetical protein